MGESKVVDKEDGIPYPDCLTTNYSDYSITAIPEFYKISAGDISKMWIHMQKVYGVPYYDDILLNMNGIGYIGELEPGSKILDFKLTDIQDFDKNKRKEVE